MNRTLHLLTHLFHSKSQNIGEVKQKDNIADFEEKRLIHLFLKGDKSAYTTIYNQYTDMLFSYGMGMGFERETIKDAIHDVFYKLYFNRNLLKNIDNLKFYLFRMLKNRLIDIHRSDVELSDITDYEMKFSIKVTIMDEMIGEEDKTALQNKIKTLLECLTDRQREGIYLRFMQEMDYEEIAELLNMTPQAARKLIFRAMERMREQGLSAFYFFIIFQFFLRIQ